MGYVGNYLELSLAEKKDWLRRQRKGYIIGDYRNHLYAVYMRVRETCESLNTNECNYEDAFPEDRIAGVYSPFECCLELFRLGYIGVRTEGVNQKLSLVAELDF